MIGNKIRKIKKELKLNSEEFAVNTGVSYRALTSYERNERKPSFEFMEALSKQYNVNLNWLISDIGQMFNAPKFEEVEDTMEMKVIEILKKQGLVK